MSDSAEKFPHYVDLHVGRQIRELRHRLRVSQERLANMLGVTFQQVQKYEKGTNRVSASKLYDVASALGVDIAALYRGLPRPETVSQLAGEGVGPVIDDPPLTEEGRQIDRLLVEMKPKRRRLMLDMARALAAQGAPSDAEDEADS